VEFAHCLISRQALQTKIAHMHTIACAPSIAQ
jgi:hypothetical protein